MLAFVGTFVLSLVMAAALAAFIGPNGAGFGAAAGAVAGVAWVVAAFGVNYLFERRSLSLFAINGGYNAVTFTVMGAIVGACRPAGERSRSRAHSPPGDYSALQALVDLFAGGADRELLGVATRASTSCRTVPSRACP